MTRAEFLGRLEPGTLVSIHDHALASIQRYRIVWRRGATLCLRLANQKHITSRIVHVPERRYVLEGEHTIHFLDARETPTLSHDHPMMRWLDDTFDILLLAGLVIFLVGIGLGFLLFDLTYG